MNQVYKIKGSAKMSTKNYKILIKSSNGVVTLRLGPLDYEGALESMDDKFTSSDVYKDFEINHIESDVLEEKEIDEIKKLLPEKYSIKYVEKDPVKKKPAQRDKSIDILPIKIEEEKKISPLEAISIKKDIDGNIIKNNGDNKNKDDKEKNSLKDRLVSIKISDKEEKNIQILPKIENKAEVSEKTAKQRDKKTVAGSLELKTKTIEQNIRSGNSIEYDGNLVVVGDVNAGAEVIATGDIIILGTLRGHAYAGSKGDENAKIIALSIASTQLRIASKIAIPSESEKKIKSKGYSIARIKDNNIVVEDRKL